MIVCKHVYYSGRVQGVGFRYTAQRIAAQHLVAGFVRNLPNGEVELVVEGVAEEVDTFLAALTGQMAAHIHRTEIRIDTAAGHTGFEIR